MGSCETISVIRIDDFSVTIKEDYTDKGCLFILKDYVNQIDIMQLYIYDLEFQIEKSDNKKVIVIDNRDPP